MGSRTSQETANWVWQIIRIKTQNCLFSVSLIQQTSFNFSVLDYIQLQFQSHYRQILWHLCSDAQPWWVYHRTHFSTVYTFNKDYSCQQSNPVPFEWARLRWVTHWKGSTMKLWRLLKVILDMIYAIALQILHWFLWTVPLRLNDPTT